MFGRSVEFPADSLPQKELVRHIETTLARSLYNCDEKYVFLYCGQTMFLTPAVPRTPEPHSLFETD